METRIYVADLAAYNAGHLHGEWIDATEDPDDIQIKIDVMLKRSPIFGAEEYAIHDFEGFEGYRLGEYDGIQKAHDVAVFIAEHGMLGVAVLGRLCARANRRNLRNSRAPRRVYRLRKNGQGHGS